MYALHNPNHPAAIGQVELTSCAHGSAANNWIAAQKTNSQFFARDGTRIFGIQLEISAVLVKDAGFDIINVSMADENNFAVMLDNGSTYRFYFLKNGAPYTKTLDYSTFGTFLASQSDTLFLTFQFHNTDIYHYSVDLDDFHMTNSVARTQINNNNLYDTGAPMHYA